MMSSILAWGWSSADSAWVKMLVDAQGHLQVDTLTAPTTDVRCYGWDGAAWQNLLVEDATNPNLRVRLYDGSDALTSGLQSDINIALSTARGLDVRTALYLRWGTDSMTMAESGRFTGDDSVGWGNIGAMLFGWSGSKAQRLRTYGTGILQVGEAVFGAVYSKTMTMADDDATRFETSAKNLRDVVIIVTTNDMLLGETGVEVYPVGVDETIGFTKVDISNLYFKNANAGANGVIAILGIEE